MISAKRLQELRVELDAERISYGELFEIQCACDEAEIPTDDPDDPPSARDQLDLLEEKIVAGGPWLVQDWAGNVVYGGKQFDTFGDAREHILEWANKLHPDGEKDRDEYLGEMYAVRVGSGRTPLTGIDRL